jgi:beta-galactosidase
MKNHLSLPSAFPLRHGLCRFAMLVTNLVTTGVVGAAGVEFDRPFAPLPGLVKNEEKPFREELCLNGSWQFQPLATPEGWTAGKDWRPKPGGRE